VTASGPHSIGSDAWLLKELKGASFLDSCVIAILKAVYLSHRRAMRVLVGRKRRDKYYLDHKMSIGKFLYGAVGFLRLDKTLLLQFTSWKHGFKFYSYVTDKINNFRIDDVYKSMMTHEEYVLEQFSPKPGNVVVDVGAAFGFYTILASKRVGISGKVVAIEPQPQLFEMLKRNIKLNNLQNIVLLDQAAYSKAADLKLFDNYSIVAERAKDANVASYTEVKADTLDNMLASLDLREVDWIKMDIEGAELDALRGAERTLADSKNLTLVVEAHSPEIFTQVTAFLKARGFGVTFEAMGEGRDWGHIVASNGQR
jgi:FkbM family methyltransferase